MNPTDIEKIVFLKWQIEWFIDFSIVLLIAGIWLTIFTIMVRRDQELNGRIERFNKNQRVNTYLKGK